MDTLDKKNIIDEANRRKLEVKKNTIKKNDPLHPISSKSAAHIEINFDHNFIGFSFTKYKFSADKAFLERNLRKVFAKASSRHSFKEEYSITKNAKYFFIGVEIPKVATEACDLLEKLYEVTKDFKFGN